MVCFDKDSDCRFVTEYAITVAFVSFVLRLIVGFLNISGKESTKFLIAIIVLLTDGIVNLAALLMLIEKEIHCL